VQFIKSAGLPETPKHSTLFGFPISSLGKEPVGKQKRSSTHAEHSEIWGIWEAPRNEKMMKGVKSCKEV
jgi:hypothetical protein